MATERRALRALLRLCRDADRQPAQALPLLGRPPRRYDMQQGRPMRMEEGANLPFLEDAMRELMGGSTEFAHPSGTAARAARRHFQRARAIGLPHYAAEARELRLRLEAAKKVAAEVGLGSWPVVTPPTQAEEGGSGMPVLEPFTPGSGRRVAAGDFLLTHPLSCISSTVFDQAVILMDSVDEHGATGVMLNKPSGTKLGEMLERWQNPEDRRWIGELALSELLDCRLFKGGPVLVPNSLEESLRWLHRYGEDLPGAREVAPGVWQGGSLHEVARRAKGDTSGVRFFIGFAGWARSQLAVELECGIWLRARAGPSETRTAALCFCPEERAPAWRLAMAGAQRPLFAGFPRSSGVDKRLRGYMERAMQRKVDLQAPAEEPAGPATATAAAGAQAGRRSRGGRSSRR